MNLIINHSSMQPIYEQIVNQIKDKIMHGELLEETMLPSVRTLAKDLKVSALTVKKAYGRYMEWRHRTNSNSIDGFYQFVYIQMCIDPLG